MPSMYFWKDTCALSCTHNTHRVQSVGAKRMYGYTYLVAEVEQESTFAAAFGDVLILARLQVRMDRVPY